jgi:hypothetical protein
LSSIPAHPSDGSPNYAYYVHRRFTPDNEWLTTSSAYTFTVTITALDTIDHFVSETFEFRAINPYNAPQPITVTEGSFDRKTQ